MPPTILNKRGTAKDLSRTNMVLGSGEMCLETDTNKIKFGDGITSWNNLEYAILPNSGVSINYPSISGGSGNFNFLRVNGTSVSVSGHSHTASNITDFNSSVSGLLPLTNIVGGTNISVIPSGTVYTVSVSGSLGLTTEEVDDRVSNLLVAGSGINLNYNDNANTLTINNTAVLPIASTVNQGSVQIVDGGGINVSNSGQISSIGSQLYLWANFR